VLPVNREACGFLSDLQAAADDRLFQDVAHGLATASLPGGGGLVPDGEDPLLFTSLPTAVELLVDRYPQIRGAINDRFAPADQLRVTQAIAEGDAAAVERVTVHYCGTPAAASAHAWLGDRFLSGGAFVSALDHYRRAQSAAPPGGRLGLAARVRLAAAMLGRDEGEPVRGPVVLGGQEIAAEQFENWVREMLARERPRGAAANGPQRPLTLLPAGLEPKRLMAFDGDLGQEGGPPPFSAPTDWVARQLAVAPAGDVLLVSNRFQVAAIELGSARRRWTCSLGGDQGPRQGWPAVPMRPVAAGRRVYARLLPKSGHPQIACLDLATGTRLWQRDCPGDIISDPLLVGNRVLALAVESPPGLPPALAWVEFDRDSGDVIARKFLLELRSAWRAHQMCQATVVGQRVVAAVGGLLFSFDPDKQILWLRTSLVVPPSIDYMLGFPYPEPPLAADGRLYATQSGLPTVECVDAETGRAYWRRCLPGLRRIVDLTDDRLVVSAGDSLVALRARTGEILWRREVPGLLEGVIKPGPGLLLCGSTKSLGGGFSCPALLWLDLETGRTKAQNPLTALRAKQPALGPMVAMHNRLWCFTGDRVNPGDPKRDIVELAPKGPAQPPDPEQP
jgi:outer membrane protein assembly factor BamB